HRVISLWCKQQLSIRPIAVRPSRLNRGSRSACSSSNHSRRRDLKIELPLLQTRHGAYGSWQSLSADPIRTLSVYTLMRSHPQSKQNERERNFNAPLPP